MHEEVTNTKADNRHYLRFSLMLADLPPIDIADPDAVRERGELYLRHCLENDLPPGVVGLCLALGIDRRTFSGWASGAHRARTHQAIAIRFKNLMESLTVSRMLEGDLCPTVGIFFLKNHHGYRDQSEMVIEKSNETVSEDPLTVGEIRKRYIHE